MKLSLCMIVKDEAATLSACLDSVQGIVDEIIVLDTGSTDDTIAIAQARGAIVSQMAWPDDFAIARNESLRLAQGDWVLVLDADERLNPAIAADIRAAIAQPQALVINLVRQEIGAVQSPYSAVSRLFRRHPRLRFHRPYHAMIDDSVAALLAQEPQWQIHRLPTVAIWHDGYQPTAIARQDKATRARVAMERYAQAHPHDPYVASKLGALDVQLGNWNRGVERLQQALQVEVLDPTVRYELHYHLGIAYRQQNQLALAAQHYQAALQQPILPLLQIGAALNLGAIYQAMGQFLAAQQQYEQVIQTDPTFAPGYYNLGLVLKAQGQFPAAIAAYHQALQHHPDYAAAYQNLGVVYLKLGQVTESLAAFQQAIARYDQTDPAMAQHLRHSLAELGWAV